MSSKKSTHKFSRFWYLSQVRKLRKIGAISDKGYKRLDRNQRRRIRYRLTKYKAFLGRSDSFETVKRLTKKQRYGLRKVLPREYFTERGVLIPLAQGSKGIRKVRISKEGELSFRMDELRALIVPLDRKKFAVSPREAVKDALRGKRYQFVRILNNGHMLREHGMATNLKEFLEYYENGLVPLVTDPNRKDGGMDARTFSQVFTLELVGYVGDEDSDYDFDEQIREVEEDEQLEFGFTGIRNAPPSVKRDTRFFPSDDEDDEDDEDGPF